MKNILILISFLSFSFSNDFFYNNGKKIFVQQKQTRSISKTKQYVTQSGKTLSFTNEIIVTCKKNTICLEDIKKMKLKNISKISKNFYLVKVDKNQNIFKLSQKLYDLPSVKSAQPNFIKKRINR